LIWIISLKGASKKKNCPTNAKMVEECAREKHQMDEREDDTCVLLIVSHLHGGHFFS
jgi:hypothetical protein